MNIDQRIPGLDHSKTTRSYAAWHFDEIELRSFLLASARGMSAWFSLKESEAKKSVGRMNPEGMYGGEDFDHFMAEVGIFWETYWYQLASAVVKDAFTLFEVFLEESAHSVLRRHNSGLKNLATEDSWRPHECKDFFEDYLEITVFTENIEDIRWIRNKLSHLRDELRTEEGKADFNERLGRLDVLGPVRPEEEGLDLSHFEYGRALSFSKSLVLSPLEAWRILNIMREHIEHLALLFHSIEWGHVSTGALQTLSEGAPARTRDRSLIHVPPAS